MLLLSESQNIYKFSVVSILTTGGPRPPLPEEVAQYDDYQKLRLVVTPGLTCYWQTANDRNDIPFDKWVEMDIDYIEHRTMLTDLKLLFKTALVVITREGR